MIKELVKLSNHLDSKGLAKEADRLDKIITKIAQGFRYVDPAGDTHESGHIDPATGQPPEKLNTGRPAFSEEAGFVSAGELGYNDATAGAERKSDDELRQLGYTHEDDSESYNDAYVEFGGGEAKPRQDRPLEFEELKALILADKGPGPYKLTEERLGELSYGKLNKVECEIIGGCE
tara:strand:+ start:3979 stop:4509 length:531 start_codon:yes stop_codon:yes gene_type:complete